MQSDCIEGEFGAIRQMSGGNYYVSLEQVVCSAKLRRMKFFTLLETEEKYRHKEAPSCSTELTDEELETVDLCPVKLAELSAEETATLYYMSGKLGFILAHKQKFLNNYNISAGFVAHMEDIPSDLALPTIPIDTADQVPGEFLEMLSRGRLRHPPEWRFRFTCFSLTTTSCSKRMKRIFPLFLRTISQTFHPNPL